MLFWASYACSPVSDVSMHLDHLSLRCVIVERVTMRDLCQFVMWPTESLIRLANATKEIVLSTSSSSSS